MFGYVAAIILTTLGVLAQGAAGSALASVQVVEHLRGGESVQTSRRRPLSFLGQPAECQCKFSGDCYCKDVLEYLDCVANSCHNPACNCAATQYKDSCDALGPQCDNLELGCGESKVTCAMEAIKKTLPPTLAPLKTVTPPPTTAETIAADLELLKAERCKHLENEKDGWLNADNRRRELEQVIEEKSTQLRKLGGQVPDMRCASEIPPAAAEAKGPCKNKGILGEAGHLASEAVSGAERGGRSAVRWYVGSLISLIIFCIASFYVYKWHHQMKDTNKDPHCGWRSILCGICCTPLTICFPIDPRK